MTNIIPIPICMSWDSRTTPIPIPTEVGSANLFIFLFAGKLLFADHWKGLRLQPAQQACFITQTSI